MNVEEMLKRYAVYKEMIKGYKVELAQEKYNYENGYDAYINISSFGSERVQESNGKRDSIVERAVEELEKLYGKKILRLTKLINDAEEKIAGIEDMVNSAELSNNEFLYIKYRYFDGLQVSAIHRKMHYSERQVRNHKNSAFKKIEGYLESMKSCA